MLHHHFPSDCVEITHFSSPLRSSTAQRELALPSHSTHKDARLSLSSGPRAPLPLTGLLSKTHSTREEDWLSAHSFFPLRQQYTNCSKGNFLWGKEKRLTKWGLWRDSGVFLYNEASCLCGDLGKAFIDDCCSTCSSWEEEEESCLLSSASPTVSLHPGRCWCHRSWALAPSIFEDDQGMHRLIHVCFLLSQLRCTMVSICA